MPLHSNGIPFAPFSKNERLGRIADWTASAMSSGKGPQGRTAAVSTAFTAPTQFEDDEDTFHTVDTRAEKKKTTFGRPKFTAPRERPQRRDDGSRGGRDFGRQGQRGGPGFNRRFDPKNIIVTRESSVEVAPEWQVVDKVLCSTLSKTQIEDVPEPEVLKEMGELRFYERSTDRITTKTEARLKRAEKSTFERLTTSEDPVLRQFADAGAGQVFITDALLATIMAAPRSLFSWDIVVTYSNGKMFFDSRPGVSQELATVNETSAEAPVDDPALRSENLPQPLNSQTALSLEAIKVNSSFQQHAVNEKIVPFPSPAPFAPNIGYRYLSFELDEDLTVVCRCDVDAITEGRQEGQTHLVLMRALLAYDPKTSLNWRKQLDAQRAAVLATEMHDNANKMARWCMQSLVSGVDQIKIAFVSRNHPRDSSSHVISGVHSCRPSELATQMNVIPKSMWGVFKYFVDKVQELGEGKYVILKDPMESSVRIYQVPATTFVTESAE